MEVSQIYIIIGIVALLIIALLVVFVSRKRKRQGLTPLAGISLGFVIAGIVVGDPRWLGYSFFGIAVILSVIDIILAKSRKK